MVARLVKTLGIVIGGWACGLVLWSCAEIVRKIFFGMLDWDRYGLPLTYLERFGPTAAAGYPVACSWIWSSGTPSGAGFS